MKRKLAGVLLCVLSLFGCNNDVDRPAAPPRSGGVTIETPRGNVVVKNAVRNLDEKYLTADVVGDDVKYTFRLTSVGDGNSVTGGVAELLDESGQLAISLATMVNNDTGEVVFTETTPDDYLTHSIVSDDERVREHYDANGDVATFEYPLLSDDTQRRAVNYYEHGLNPAALPDRVEEYITVVGAFDAYYEPHAKSTLHDNPSGELLARILASPDLEGLVGQVGGPGAQRLIDIGNVCNLARGCQTLVCYTNPGSLICFACTAVSVACAIFDFICGWFGC